MRLIFSEYKQDLKNYIYAYMVWAYPDSETPAEMYAHGFLPSKKDLTRWYKTRSLRVALQSFKPSSENRRILKKGQGIDFKIIRRQDFVYNKKIKAFCKRYADIRFGKDVMDSQRLDITFNSACCSHVMAFIDNKTSQEVGYVILYIETKKMAHYYYSFYDLNYYVRNLGMYMMTVAVNYLADQGFGYIYLGTCYTRNALYKTQFKGMEFYNGLTWSRNLKELKYMINRRGENVQEHLFEDEEYVSRYMS